MQIKLCNRWVKRRCHKCHVKTKIFWLVDIPNLITFGNNIKFYICPICHLTKTSVSDYMKKVFV